MAVALGVLAVGEEPLRHHEMQVVLCARHSDVEQAAFFLDLSRRTGPEIRWYAAVDNIEYEHGFPLLPFG